MEPILDAALNLFPTIVFCVVVWILVNLQRRILEKWIFPFIKERFSKNPGESSFYREIALPSAPLGTAVFLSLSLPQYPLPEVIPGNVGRVFIGLFLGLCAGWVYRVVKKYFQSKIQSITGTGSSPGGSENPPDSIDSTDLEVKSAELDSTATEDKTTEVKGNVQ